MAASLAQQRIDYLAKVNQPVKFHMVEPDSEKYKML